MENSFEELLKSALAWENEGNAKFDVDPEIAETLYSKVLEDAHKLLENNNDVLYYFKEFIRNFILMYSNDDGIFLTLDSIDENSWAVLYLMFIRNEEEKNAQALIIGLFVNLLTISNNHEAKFN